LSICHCDLKEAIHFLRDIIPIMNIFNRFKLNLDITAGIGTAFLLALGGAVLAFLLGVNAIKKGNRIVYFRKRQAMVSRGWRLILVSMLLVGAAFVLNNFGESAIYSIFPPSPTITNTPTVTLTPTITLSPTVSLTPTITNTPSITDTPAFPEFLKPLSTSETSPGEALIFSPIQFTRELGDDGMPIETLEIFENPIRQIIGFFSFDKMIAGGQFFFVWYRVDDRMVVCSSATTEGISTGGYASAICAPDDSDIWLPGEYELQIFAGNQWYTSGRFQISGMPLTKTPTITPTSTISPSPTRTYTHTASATFTATATATATITRTPTVTRTPTITRTPSLTWTPSRTVSPTNTRTPTLTWTPSKTPTITSTITMTPTKTATRTPRPTDTRIPTLTLTHTATLWPTKTLRPTDTSRPTLTKEP